jgi:hypothetical protein
LKVEFDRRARAPEQAVQLALAAPAARGDAARRVVVVGEELAWVGAGFALQWGHAGGTEAGPRLAVADADGVAGELRTAGEVVVVARPDVLTHDRIDRWLEAADCDFGVLTGRSAAGMTWSWHKDAIWEEDTDVPELASLDWAGAGLERWRVGTPAADAVSVPPESVAGELTRPIALLSVMGHGSGIDMDVGGVAVMCGRTRAALRSAVDDAERPACAVAGAVCPRNPDGRRQLVTSDSICARMLFANTCRGAAFAASTYSIPMSLALGVLDGPTAAFLSAHRLRLIDRSENAFVESCAVVGMTAGRIARRLNELVAAHGEPRPFLLVGRPDVRPVLPRHALPEAEIAWPQGAHALHDEGDGDLCLDRALDQVSAAWRCLSYWRLHLPLLRAVADEEGLPPIDGALDELEETLLEAASVGAPRLRHRMRPLAPAVVEDVGLAVGETHDVLAPVVGAALVRHGSFLVYRLLPLMQRSGGERLGRRCGCGGELLGYRVTGRLDPAVARVQEECATCGIVYDGPRLGRAPRYDGPSQARIGTTADATWHWHATAEPRRQPTVKLALRHSACDPERIEVSAAPPAADGPSNYSMATRLRVAEDAIAETYWLNAVFMSGLEMTYRLERFRVLTGERVAGPA